MSGTQALSPVGVTPGKVIDLNATHRCDTCGAQAFTFVVVNKADLYYCGHHFNKYEAKLTDIAEFVSDQRDKINVKASASSPD